MSDAGVIELERVSRRYASAGGDVDALVDVTLRIAGGELVAVMGPSGSGKSSLLNVLGLLDAPTSGRYVLLGRDVGGVREPHLTALRARAIGFVFQSFNLLGHRSVLDNVALPLVYRGVRLRERRARARHWLERVGLAAVAGRLPGQLSGGQQQRVAIARALCAAPRVVLADEPTGNLDSRTASEILDLLVALNRSDGVAVVLVTHDAAIAKRTRRLLVLTDGRLTYDGPPQ